AGCAEAPHNPGSGVVRHSMRPSSDQLGGFFPVTATLATVRPCRSLTEVVKNSVPVGLGAPSAGRRPRPDPSQVTASFWVRSAGSPKTIAGTLSGAEKGAETRVGLGAGVGAGAAVGCAVGSFGGRGA